MHERNDRPSERGTESGLQVSSPIPERRSLKEVLPLQRQALLLNLALIGFLASGCGASMTTYAKPEAPWGVVKRVAVLPFAIPSENPVDRSLTTQLFAEELRKSGRVEVTEVPLESPVGSSRARSTSASVGVTRNFTNGLTMIRKKRSEK